MDGILNIFKNTEMSSFDVVRRIKRVACERKVGHTGTLDPAACGVLPVCLGKATKIIDYIMSDDKSYVVKMKLGTITTTYDLEGEVVKESDCSHLKEEEVLSVVESFIGGYNQVPPMYSALKQNGVRLYKLARQGIEVEREGRDIKIFHIKDIDISLPYISMEVSCSKGTYIRSLCYDIGEKLQVGGVMTYLRRNKTSVFSEENSINIEDLNEDNVQENLITIEEALKKYPPIYANEGFGKLLINGVRIMDRRLTLNSIEDNVLYRVYDENTRFLGLGKRNSQGFKMEKLLL